MRLGSKGRHLLEQRSLKALEAANNVTDMTDPGYENGATEQERGLWLQESFACLEALGQWQDIREKVFGNGAQKKLHVDLLRWQGPD